ncbi:MAG: acyl-CoA thioesterase [Synergistetes bacterium]|nr:acyl-CoA thioesterase [Synergistota bacterium]
MEVLTEIRVRYGETDQMGVVYYGSYYDWFEVGRTEFCRKLGLPYAKWESMGIFLPAVESYCRYKHPVCYDERVEIVTSIKELTATTVTFSYKVRGVEDRRLLAVGYTKHAFVGRNGRLTELPSEIRSLLKKSK